MKTEEILTTTYTVDKEELLKKLGFAGPYNQYRIWVDAYGHGLTVTKEEKKK